MQRPASRDGSARRRGASSRGSWRTSTRVAIPGFALHHACRAEPVSASAQVRPLLADPVGSGLEIAFGAAEIAKARVTVRMVEIPLRAADGAVRTVSARARIEDAPLRSDATLTPAASELSWTAQLQGDGVPVDALPALAGLVTGAQADIRGERTGAGTTPADWRRVTTGQILIGIGPGTLVERGADRAHADLPVSLHHALNPFSSTDRSARLNCARRRALRRRYASAGRPQSGAADAARGHARRRAARPGNRRVGLVAPIPAFGGLETGYGRSVAVGSRARIAVGTAVRDRGNGLDRRRPAVAGIPGDGGAAPDRGLPGRARGIRRGLRRRVAGSAASMAQRFVRARGGSRVNA